MVSNWRCRGTFVGSDVKNRRSEGGVVFFSWFFGRRLRLGVRGCSFGRRISFCRDILGDRLGYE